MKDWIETTQTAQTGDDRVLIRKKAISAVVESKDGCIVHIGGEGVWVGIVGQTGVHVNMPFDELSKEILPQLGRPKKGAK
jgi:hypothetical protein